MSYMVELARHLTICGHSKSLKSLKKFMDAQAEQEVKPLEARKHNFVGDIEAYKEKLLKKFEEARERVQKRIGPSEADEKQEIEKKAKYFE